MGFPGCPARSPSQGRSREAVATFGSPADQKDKTTRRNELVGGRSIHMAERPYLRPAELLLNVVRLDVVGLLQLREAARGVASETAELAGPPVDVELEEVAELVVVRLWAEHALLRRHEALAIHSVLDVVVPKEGLPHRSAATSVRDPRAVDSQQLSWCESSKKWGKTESFAAKYSHSEASPKDPDGNKRLSRLRSRQKRTMRRPGEAYATAL
eukprot:scaffold3330_cov398-Pinguiococcus_pyrenoidosus.AAC.1